MANLNTKEIIAGLKEVKMGVIDDEILDSAISLLEDKEEKEDCLDCHFFKYGHEYKPVLTPDLSKCDCGADKNHFHTSRCRMWREFGEPDFPKIEAKMVCSNCGQVVVNPYQHRCISFG